MTQSYFRHSLFPSGQGEINQEMEDDFQQRKSTIFVDNLPNGIRKGFMYNLISRFGRIRDCYIPNKKSRITRQSFGFVRYESSRDAFQAAESTNGTWIWGQELLGSSDVDYDEAESGDVGLLTIWNPENSNQRAGIKCRTKRLGQYVKMTLIYLKVCD
ncbi:hypothetical protein RHSIM_Rhsim02G0133000 [Rhododendron simsii]|uniref:RRM domain-containing protein n=1 Tax=Rhododendron simsii TaxID=118357 RepID=A0A834HLD3_RHOSS|nr:hypothetical protein RHSIM_Rhsim02G0133000 [Rhododendron simsii]